MKGARRVTMSLGAVALLAAAAVGFLAAGHPGMMRYAAGVPDDQIINWLVAVCSVLLVATMVSGAVWAARGGTAARRWLSAILVVLAVVSIVPLGWISYLGVWASAFATYTRFDAPDGTAYLLEVDSEETGRLAVYQDAGYARWRLLPSFADRGLPGPAPCTPQATPTEFIVHCSGNPAIAPR